MKNDTYLDVDVSMNIIRQIRELSPEQRAAFLTDLGAVLALDLSCPISERVEFERGFRAAARRVKAG